MSTAPATPDFSEPHYLARLASGQAPGVPAHPASLAARFLLAGYGLSWKTTPQPYPVPSLQAMSPPRPAAP